MATTTGTVATGRTVFVSGAAGGLGRATVEHLAARGWRVFGADLPGDRLTSLAEVPNVVTLPLDVTHPDSVAAAADAVAAEVTGLDAVVTFAGILVVGSVAEIDEAAMQRIVDVNLLGTYRVVRALFDLVVARGGRVLLISSETGWQTSAPFNGPYALTKHAVEAYADSLRREARLVGVSVVKIQPGPFRTDMVAGIEPAFERAAAGSKYFAPLLRRMGPMAAREARKANDPAVLAATIAEAVTADRPRIAYSVRPDRLRSGLEWLPKRWADRLIVLGLRRLNR
jgi:NAD(P)-dependent dehydrogenase (short-subunit alcohol dehydrogenase family)